MKIILFIILAFLEFSAVGQSPKLKRTITIRDISDSAKQYFYRQLDTLDMYQAGSLPPDQRFQYLVDSSSLTVTKNGMPYGINRNFGRLDGIVCGYHEADEPYKITVSEMEKEVATPAIHDFYDSTAWISSGHSDRQTLKLFFNKGFPPLTKLIFFSGDQSNIANWNNYSRPKTIFVYLNGTYWSQLNLEDCICRQEFEFSPVSSRKGLIITLVITDIYEGKDKRVAISDINFDGIIH